MELVLKTSDAEKHRGFESLSLRQRRRNRIWRSTQVAVRGSPAKGVDWGNRCVGSNPTFSANRAKASEIRAFLFFSRRFGSLDSSRKEEAALRNTGYMPDGCHIAPQRAGFLALPVVRRTILRRRRRRTHLSDRVRCRRSRTSARGNADIPLLYI